METTKQSTDVPITIPVIPDRFVNYETKHKKMPPVDHWFYLVRKLKEATKNPDFEDVAKNMRYHHYERVKYIDDEDSDSESCSSGSETSGEESQNDTRKRKRSHYHEGMACVCRHAIGHVHWIYDSTSANPKYLFPIGSCCIKRFPNIPETTELKMIAELTETRFKTNMTKCELLEDAKIENYGSSHAEWVFDQVRNIREELPSFKPMKLYKGIYEYYQRNDDISDGQMKWVKITYQNARKCYKGKFGIPWFENRFDMTAKPSEEGNIQIS
jgi:hypothetical protein